MRLERINIGKFRSIDRCTIVLNSLCGLVGENNSGKSSILRALNAFFNFELEEENFMKKNHQYSPNSQSKIELIFSDISDTNKYGEYMEGNKLILKATYSFSNNRRKIQYKKNNKYNTIGLDFIDRLKEDIHFCLIPNDRDFSQTLWSEGTILRELSEEYLKIMTSKRDSLSSSVKKASDIVEKQALSKIAKELEKYYSLNHSFEFKLGYDRDIGYKLLLNNISLKVEDHGRVFDISDCGSGIQSLTVIALYRGLANLLHTNFILGIEEPETYLHPQLQRELIESIKRVSNSGKEIQVLFTTHSAVISDQLLHNEIVLFRKVNDDRRGFKTATYQVPTNFWDKHNLNDFKYYQFYKYRNSEFFFAKYVIIVESKNDAEAVKLLLDDLDIDLNIYGISIINLEGIGNIKYPYYLMKYLNIPYLIVVDKDFFVPYFNGKLSKSRYDSGFPKYKYEFKDESFIEELIPLKTDRIRLLNLLKENHSKALDILQKYNIICFRHSLEIDLISSSKARNKYFEIFKIPSSEQTTEKLLVDYKDGIKRIDHILNVLKCTPHQNLPNSYKRIKKYCSYWKRDLDASKISSQPR